MKAVKGNKEYTINEASQKGYQDMGFDILNEDGKVIAYGRGKTVTYDEHMKAVREIERLRALTVERNAENEALRAELAAFRTAAEQASEKRARNKKEGE